MREKILAMTAGRTLDALIAEDVMKWYVSEGEYSGKKYWNDGDNYSPYSVEDFKPSTDISAAWEVVEKLKLKMQIFTYFHDEEEFEDGWLVKIDGKHVEGIDSAPEAICKAALLSVMDL